MSQHNEELERMVDELASILDDADGLAMGKDVDRKTNRRLAASFLEYTYALGKVDGAAMMAKVGAP